MSTAADSKRYYDNNIEKCREGSRKRAKLRKINNPIKYILNLARNRAKANGVEFNLDESDIVIPDFCEVLGIPIYYQLEGKHHGSPSLDRISPDLGYIKGNIRVISLRANILKNNATSQEIELVLKDLKRLKQ